jgi:two-component system phosphate regulon sensor histidine kinase PhoR
MGRFVSRSQLKLMATVSGLIVFVVAVSGFLAERGLREREMSRIARSLEERAGLVRELVRDVAFDAQHVEVLDAIADRSQSAAAARVTLIDRGGIVVGDSNVPLSKLPAVESHANRPEFREALRGVVGTSTRRSATVGRELFYLAIPAEGEHSGVVRLAVDLSDVDAAVSELRRKLLAAGAIGLVAAIAFSYALSWLTLRPLREMQQVAASIAGGNLDRRLTSRSVDELGGISTAINEMADQIRQRLDEVGREKEQLQAVLDGMVEGVLVIDTGGRILLVNHRLRDFFDVSGEALGRTPIEVIRDAAVDELLAEAATTDEPVSRKITSTGEGRRTFRVHAVGFPSNGRRRIGTVAVFHDITEVVRLEAVRRDFVANASHELRTPVAAIRGFAETLLTNGGLSESDRRTALEIIDRHSIRLTNLVTDLLELSRIEEPEGDFTPARVDVGAIAEAIVREARARTKERGLSVDLHASAEAIAWGSRQDVEQVIANLVDNAVNYTDEGGRIEVEASADENRVWVRVADTGIGISRSDQERIFERFYRVDTSRSRALGGTGLGLSIVKHLVRRMEGEIGVESEPGKGSTFSFWLPRAKRDRA